MASVAVDRLTSGDGPGGAAGDGPERPTVVDRPRPRIRELSPRALIVGCALGALLAAGNVYTGLKTAFIDGGMITASLLSFGLFALWRRRTATPFGPLENNVAQTAAASAAVMTFVHGTMGPMPALALLGQPTAPALALWIWGLALAVLGIAVGVLFRRKLIDEDGLAFPTGAATAAVIQAAHYHAGSAARRTRLLVVAALAAAACTWLRDARPALIPAAFALPGTIAGVAASSLTLGLAASPLMAATGTFIGLRGALTMGIGGALVWGGLAPLVHRAGWVQEAGYSALVGWLVWPALGLLLGSTLGPLLLGGPRLARALARGLRDVRGELARAQRDGDAGATSAGERWRARAQRIAAATVLALAAVAMLCTAWLVFGVSPLIGAGALVLALFMAVICARAAGETDLAPVGPVGTLTQLATAGAGTATSIVSSAITGGAATQTAQMLWAFRAGAGLNASRRAQIVAQLVGALAGSLVVVPVYSLLARSFTLGSEAMPAPAALTLKASAQALSGGAANLPPYAAEAAAVGAAVGLTLALLARTRAARFLPSATTLGIAIITPASLSAAALLGAGAVALARRLRPSFGEGEASALAAGALAGEAMTGVLVAILGALGALG